MQKCARRENNYSIGGYCWQTLSSSELAWHVGSVTINVYLDQVLKRRTVWTTCSYEMTVLVPARWSQLSLSLPLYSRLRPKDQIIKKNTADHHWSLYGFILVWNYITIKMKKKAATNDYIFKDNYWRCSIGHKWRCGAEDWAAYHEDVQQNGGHFEQLM